MKDYTVFVSYSHHDGKEFAERLSELLNLVFTDIRVFWDRELIAGEYFWDKLLEEVRHCDHFLYLVSDKSTTMPSGCIRELCRAKFYEKHIVPCILPSYTGEPNSIPGLPELKDLLYVDLREGIENATNEMAKLYGAIYESIVNASPVTQFHRRQMMLLYEILGKLTDDKMDGDYYKVGQEVYERGYELEYDAYPPAYGRVSKSLCLEVVDILAMMEYLQEAWTEFSDEERERVKHELDERVEYLVNNVGFCGNHESQYLAYMRFLNQRGGFTTLRYAFSNGNSHMRNLPNYRAMLREYNRIKREDSNDFFRGRNLLSVEEVTQILQAQKYVITHPL